MKKKCCYYRLNSWHFLLRDKLCKKAVHSTQIIGDFLASRKPNKISTGSSLPYRYTCAPSHSPSPLIIQCQTEFRVFAQTHNIETSFSCNVLNNSSNSSNMLLTQVTILCYKFTLFFSNPFQLNIYWLVRFLLLPI